MLKELRRVSMSYWVLKHCAVEWTGVIEHW